MPADDGLGDSGGESSGGEPPSATDVSLSVDAIFDLLTDAERRRILELLVETPEPTATIDELLTRLVRWETDRTGEFPSPDSIELRLHHIHLPKLAKVGVVEYDPRNEELRYYGDDRLEEWLRLAQEGGSG